MLRISAAIVIACLSVNVNAALVDNDLYTTDTASGLDWLDLTETVGMNYADAFTNNSEWRYATHGEVESLFALAFQGYYHTNTEGYSDSNGGAYANQKSDALNWINMFGNTRGVAGNTTVLSYGFFYDEEGLYRYMGAQYNPSNDGSSIFSPEFVDDWDSYILDQDGMDIAGVFMVRSSVVPIPAAVWLFGSGLGLLGWFRRRQTA
jgi:hypothetical protein